MLSAGWKDFLRPIRDGLRKLIPPVESPPEETETPEQRQRRRHVDALRGFTYFESFHELDDWTPDHADPIVRCDTPLQPRPTFPHDQGARAKVLLVHDASGNYHDYESIQGVDLQLEDRYSCRYLRHVETFVYFSHKLVCVPPPTWTTTLHRNGVKSLGTLLVEPQTEGSNRILHCMHHRDGGCNATTTFCLASKLAALAEAYGFDGWLVNIEKPFSSDVWDPTKLATFLTQLRDELGPRGKVVWYDALTAGNRVEYQNALTDRNVSFAGAAGAMLANYTWTEASLPRSIALAKRHGIDLADVYFGVDVWAQNSQRGLRRRVTYPARGGGGTNTGLAVAKLAEFGLSVGIFAPAWSHEHFPAHGRVVERAMWEGYTLPDDLTCSCGDSVHLTSDYRVHPIMRHALQYPSGTERSFYTGFREAFAATGSADTAHLRSQLGSQEPSPVLEQEDVTDNRGTGSVEGARLDARMDCRGVLQIFAAPSRVLKDGLVELTLFYLNMLADGTLDFTMSFWDYITDCAAIGLRVRLAYSHGGIDMPFEQPDRPQHGTRQTLQCTVVCPCESPARHCRLNGIQIRAAHLPPKVISKEPILLVEELRIVPSAERPSKVELSNLRLMRQGHEDERHWRLKWDCKVPKEPATSRRLKATETSLTRLDEPPHRYAITIMAEELNDVFVCELVVPAKHWTRLEEGKDLSVALRAFDMVGRELARVDETLQVRKTSSDGWELVD